MLDSNHAIQVLIENYPDFEELTDHFYDQEEVLLCVEMYYFAEYIWSLSESDINFEFNKLRSVLDVLILSGDSKVKMPSHSVLSNI